ncbi:hypothetical protein POM88_047222 [Heracleum sosnowskyi]|uniref:Uncharacterized protein n=1 Tax=Heracleum sosnowskyi TaxID=360622 RepID=A0AAD8GTV9_9APIA|nr:hypothetical protein POM88_047222 [Heracleum sosnowskyi]
MGGFGKCLGLGGLNEHKIWSPITVQLSCNRVLCVQFACVVGSKGQSHIGGRKRLESLLLVPFFIYGSLRCYFYALRFLLLLLMAYSVLSFLFAAAVCKVQV